MRHRRASIIQDEIQTVVGCSVARGRFPFDIRGRSYTVRRSQEQDAWQDGRSAPATAGTTARSAPPRPTSSSGV